MLDSQAGLARRVTRWTLWLGIAYIATGSTLLASILTGWLRLFAAALGSTLLLSILSLGAVVYREGLVTPENRGIALCVLGAMGLLFGFNTDTNLTDEVSFVAVFVVGVVVPHLIVGQLGYGAEP